MNTETRSLHRLGDPQTEVRTSILMALFAAVPVAAAILMVLFATVPVLTSAE